MCTVSSLRGRPDRDTDSLRARAPGAGETMQPGWRAGSPVGVAGGQERSRASGRAEGNLPRESRTALVRAGPAPVCLPTQQCPWRRARGQTAVRLPGPTVCPLSPRAAAVCFPGS